MSKVSTSSRKWRLSISVTSDAEAAPDVVAVTIAVAYSRHHRTATTTRRSPSSTGGVSASASPQLWSSHLFTLLIASQEVECNVKVKMKKAS